MLSSSSVHPSGHPHDGPFLHQTKERLINGCTRTCRQEVCTGEHRPYGVVCNGLPDRLRSFHVRNYCCFSDFVNITSTNLADFCYEKPQKRPNSSGFWGDLILRVTKTGAVFAEIATDS
jgi:hypothetical protein